MKKLWLSLMAIGACVPCVEQMSVEAKEPKPKVAARPLKKIYVVDTVSATSKSGITAEALNTCGAAKHLMNAVVQFAPTNNLQIEKVNAVASKELPTNVLRLEIDQIYNTISKDEKSSRLSVNARYTVSDGSQRGHNFDCSVEAVFRPPYINMWSCPRFVRCSKLIGKDIAYWLTAFE